MTHKRDKAYIDWQNGMTYKDIAAKYEVSVSAVKAWAQRHWRALTPDRKNNPAGAPKGNKNATGSKSSTQFKPGQQVTLQHGGYSRIYWDTLDAEEQELIELMATDEEFQLQEQIRLLAVRERRLLKAIAYKKEEKEPPPADEYSVIARTEQKESSIIRLEQELTKVQRVKTQCISELYRVRTDDRANIKNDVSVIIMGESELRD